MHHNETVYRVSVAIFEQLQDNVAKTLFHFQMLPKNTCKKRIGNVPNFKIAHFFYILPVFTLLIILFVSSFASLWPLALKCSPIFSTGRFHKK